MLKIKETFNFYLTFLKLNFHICKIGICYSFLCFLSSNDFMNDKALYKLSSTIKP